MRTVFGLFHSFADADDALQHLHQDGFDIDEVNVMIRAEAARQQMAERQPAGVPASRSGGRGVRQLLAHRRTAREPELGEIFTANETANRLAAGAAPNAGAGGLKAVLENFGLEPHLANAYFEGLRNGMLLLFLNVEERKALAVSNILERHTGRSTFIFTPR